jgi:hypothetical protein
MREDGRMTHHDHTPPQLEIPASVLPHLLRLSSLNTAEIRGILGVSPQVMEEYKLGRGVLSPFKGHRLAEITGLSVTALERLVQSLESLDPKAPFTEGAKVEHPFRGAMRLEVIRGDLADIVILENERRISGIPLLAFKRDDVAALIDFVRGVRDDADHAAAPAPSAPAPIMPKTVEVAAPAPRAPRPAAAKVALDPARGSAKAKPSEPAAETAPVVTEAPVSAEAPVAVEEPVAPDASPAPGSAPAVAEDLDRTASTDPAAPPASPSDEDEAFVSTEAAGELMRSSGMTHAEMAGLLGVSRGMIGFYLSGRSRMPRERHALLSDAIRARARVAASPRLEDPPAPVVTGTVVRKRIDLSQVETVPHESTAALIRSSGLTHGEIGSLLKLSKGMIGAYVAGRYLMPRERFEAIEAEAARRRAITPDAKASDAVPEGLRVAAQVELPSDVSPGIEAEAPVEGAPAPAPSPDVRPEADAAPQTADAVDPLPEVSPEPVAEVVREAGPAAPDAAALLAGIAALFGGEAALARRLAILDAIGDPTSESAARIEARLAAIDDRLARLEAMSASKASDAGREPCPASKILLAAAKFANGDDC